MLVALALRSVLVLAVPVVPAWDGVIYLRAAHQLADGEGYTLRAINLLAPARPSAFYPVGWPALMAAMLRAAMSDRGILFMQSVFGALLVPVAWLLARRLGGTRAGQFAAWMCACWPGGILYSSSFLAEPATALLIGAALVCLAYSERRKARARVWFSDVILAFGGYVRATTLVIAPLYGALVGGYTSQARHGSARWRAAFVRGALSLAVCLLVLSPWAMRNHEALHSGYTFTSTNGGANLLLGTYSWGAYGSIPKTDDCPMGSREIDRDRCRQAKAIARIAEHPIEWLGRGVLKLLNTFGHESAPAFYWIRAARVDASSVVAQGVIRLTQLYWTAILLLGVVGLFHARRSLRLPVHLVAVIPVLAVAVVHFTYIGGDRYHAPVAPVFFAFAAIGLRTFGTKR